jgi:hypothetical protein
MTAFIVNRLVPRALVILAPDHRVAGDRWILILRRIVLW